MVRSSSSWMMDLNFVSFYDSFAYLGEIIECFDVACKGTAYAMKY